MNKDKNILQDRIDLVKDVYQRLTREKALDGQSLTPGFEQLTPTELSGLDLEEVKRTLSGKIDDILQLQKKTGHNPPASLTDEQKTRLVDLAVEGIVRQDMNKRAELLTYLDSLGFSLYPKNGADRLLTFWSDDYEGYKQVLNGKLTEQGKSGIATDFDVTALDFVHQLRKGISGIIRDSNPADSLMMRAADQGSVTIAGFLSSLYAANTAEIGGTVYVMSQGGLKVNNFFWNVELPVLRALQKAGAIGEIRILHEPFINYKDKPLTEIGSPLTASDVGVLANYKYLPQWLADEKFAALHKQWIDTKAKANLIALNKELDNYIEQHPGSRRNPTLKKLSDQTKAKLIELDEFDGMTAAERIKAARRTPVGNKVTLWSVDELLDKASVFGKKRGESYHRIMSLLEQVNKDSKPLAFCFPGDDGQSPYVTLAFHGDVIDSYSDQLKRLLPFNLLRESWGVVVTQDGATGELILSTEAGGKCRIRVAPASTIEQKIEQKKQVVALERFLLANFTPWDMPAQLAFDHEGIKSGDRVLATRNPAGSEFPWRTNLEAVEAVRTSRASEEWRVPDTTKLTKQAVDAEETSFGYTRQLIVQIQGGDTVFDAANALFGKHLRQSEWVQLKNGQLYNLLGWDSATHQVRLLDTPLSLASTGQVRLVLVGLGSVDEAGVTNFGGKTAEEWQPALRTLLDKLPADKINNLRLDLVGCELASGNPRDTLPGRLAVWLAEQAKVRGWEGMSVSARSPLVSVDANGKKWVYVESLGWISSKDAEQFDIKYKYEWTWDASSQQLIEPMGSAHEGTDGAVKRPRKELEGRYHLGDANSKEQMARKVSLRTALLTLDAEQWGEKFDKAIIKLAQKNNLDQRWMPVIANTESLGEGCYRIQFINREQPTEIQWVDTRDATFAEFRSFIDEHLRIMGQHFSLEQGQLRRQSPVGEVDSVDGLNAGFAIQALIQWFANRNRADAATGAISPDLATALTVHCYLNYVQMAHGGVQDVAKITELVRTALRGELVAAETSLMQFSSTLAHVANEGLGVILNGAMVGLDIYELAHAETETQKAVFATQLAFDSASLVTGVAAVTAGLLGASAVAAALSGPLVIIAGLAVSFTALAQAYGAVADDAQKVGRYFDMLDKAYKGGGFKYDDKQDMMVSLPGAVVKCLDLRNNQVDFDSQYIYRTTSSKTGSGKVGSGESNYFFWGGCPDIVYDRSQAIEVRSGIGYKDASHRLDHGNSKIVILPGTPKSFIKYEYQTLPGATLRGDPGFEVLRRLEKDYRFDYDFYTFPSEYIVRLIHQEYVATTINIVLDLSSRQLVVPKLPPEFYNQLHYEIKGAGGEYLISLNKGSTVRLTSDAPGSRWIIDSSQLDSDSISVSKGQVVIGGVRVDFDLTQHERLLVVNKQGEVREIDVVALTAQVVSEDASKWQRPGQNIEQHLAELAKAHQLHGQYVVVENYQHNGHNVGRAFYDVARNRMLFSDATLDQTRNALLGAVMGDHAYFYDADNATAWRAEIATGKIDAQFEPWFNQNKGKISRLWQEGEAIYLTRRYQLKSGEAELSYQLSGDQMELASVMGDDALLQRLARTGQQGDTLKELLRFYETDGIRRETPALTPGGKLVQPTGAALITVFGTDANGVAHRYWIRTSDGTLIKPNLALPADHNLRFDSNDKVRSAWPIPADLVLAGSIPAPSGVEVFFFYSKEQKALFRQEGPGQSVLDASHPGALRIDTPKLANLLNMNGSMIAITEDGRVASLDAQGHLNYCAVNEHWLKGRIHWWQDLAKITDSDTPLAVFGVKGADGTSVLTVWYHKGQVAIASEILQGKSLQFLGFEMGGASARFFEPESGKLYLQPTMTASQLVAAFGSDQTLDASAQLPAASALLPELHLKAAQQVNTALRLTTMKGELLLRTDGGNLQLVGVDRDWQQGNQLRLAEALSELATQWRAKGVLSFLLSNGAPGWFDIDSGQVFSGKGIPNFDSLRFVGVAADRKAAFVFNPVTHSLYKLSKEHPDVLNMFADVKRFSSTLLLQGGNEDLKLIVDGVDTLVLYGGAGSDTYRLSKAMWQHYSKVVIDNNDPEQAQDRLILPVETPESMLMNRLNDDLQLTDFDTGTTLVIRQVFGSQASAYQHMLIEFPNNLPTVTVSHLVKSYIKQGDTWMNLGQAAIASGIQLRFDVQSGQLKAWLTDIDINVVRTELQRYFSRPEARARLTNGRLQIAGSWQGELDMVRGEGLLVGSESGGSKTLVSWRQGEESHHVSLPGTEQVIVWRDTSGNIGFSGTYQNTFGTIVYKGSGFAGERILVDDLCIISPVDAFYLKLAERRSGGIMAYLTANTPLQLQAGAILQLVNDRQQTLVMTVTDNGVALQSATWKRNGVDYYYTKGADGNWRCQVESGQATRIELQDDDWQLLPGTDHHGLMTEVNLSEATRELVLGSRNERVTLTQSEWSGLMVHWTGTADNLHWQRHGDDLQLLQDGQIKLQWRGLLASGRESDRCWFQLADHSVNLQHYPPQQQIADGVLLAGSVEAPEVWLTQADAGKAMQQIRDHFASKMPASGIVRIRGRWNGELELSRGVALLAGTVLDESELNTNVLLKWQNGVSHRVQSPSFSLSMMKGEVVLNAAGGLSYHGHFVSDAYAVSFRFVADERDGATVVLREISDEKHFGKVLFSKLEHRSQNVSSRSVAEDVLREMGLDIRLAEGTVMKLKNEQGQTLEYKVNGDWLERRVAWQRDGINHECLKGDDGVWRYQLSGSSTERVALQGADLAMLPDEGGDGTAVVVTLPVTTQELIIESSWTRTVTIMPAAGQRLMVNLQGERGHLSWGRKEDDLLLYQDGKVRVQWSNLLSNDWCEVFAQSQLQVGGLASLISSYTNNLDKNNNTSKPAPQMESITGIGLSSVELLRQAMCSLPSAGEGGSESPTVLTMREQPSLTLPI